MSGADGQEFVWVPMKLGVAVRSAIPDYVRTCERVLPPGYTIEVCPAAVAWWKEAATRLGRGRLVAIDYGQTEEELFIPERTQGTLRACRHHQPSGDVLAHPGEQDLTAHVNFTAIQQAGEKAGLKTETLISQEHFLTHVAAQTWAKPELFEPWTAERRRQLQTLTHPQHLGRAFRVLVQSAKW
jgi:SAM-dependent MidA family methyltransferase